MRKVCPYCGDGHVCLPATAISAGSVTPPSTEEVTWFLSLYANHPGPHNDRDGTWHLSRRGSSLFYERYVALATAERRYILGRRTFNNTLVAMGWRRRKIGGWYWWVHEEWPS